MKKRMSVKRIKRDFYQVNKLDKVPEMGLEPTRTKYTRPSTVPVIWLGLEPRTLSLKGRCSAN